MQGLMLCNLILVLSHLLNMNSPNELNVYLVFTYLPLALESSVIQSYISAAGLSLSWLSHSPIFHYPILNPHKHFSYRFQFVLQYLNFFPLVLNLFSLKIVPANQQKMALKLGMGLGYAEVFMQKEGRILSQFPKASSVLKENKDRFLPIIFIFRFRES